MTDSVRAKKHLGQHFLKDENIALDIVKSLKYTSHYKKVLEVGPGMGVLTKYLIAEPAYETHLIDIDRESIAFLKKNFPSLQNKIIEGDFCDATPDYRVEKVRDPSGYFGLRRNRVSADVLRGGEPQLTQSVPESFFFSWRSKKILHSRIGL